METERSTWLRFSYTLTGFWYNKNLFEGENAKYTLPTTWEELSHSG